MIPMVKIVFAGYPSWVDASITARTFITFVMLSNRRNSTTTALIIRPVQSLPFETGPACVSDCTIRSSLVAQGAPAPFAGDPEAFSSERAEPFFRPKLLAAPQTVTLAPGIPQDGPASVSSLPEHRASRRIQTSTSVAH